jgi:branched-chain amino acid transport system substrate-binding protein
MVVASVTICHAQPVKVAFISAQTGIASVHNEPSRKGALLASAQINEAGGVLGRPFALVFHDNTSTPLGSKQAAERAIADGAAAVVGPLWSSHALVAGEVLQQAGVAMVTPLATNPKVTRIGDNIFRTCFTDDFQGRVMARFAREELEAKSAATMFIMDEAYSLGLENVFASEFILLGGRIAVSVGYRAKALDFGDQLAAIAAAKPDVVFVPGYGRDVNLLIRQARDMGLETTFLGGDAWSDVYQHGENGAEGLAGNFYSTFWHPRAPYPRSEEAQARYLETFGQLGAQNADVYMAYDAVLLVADAIERAGTAAPAAVSDAIAATDDFQGATGPIDFDDTGDPLAKGAVILRTGPDKPEFFMLMTPQMHAMRTP